VAGIVHGVTRNQLGSVSGLPLGQWRLAPEGEPQKRLWNTITCLTPGGVGTRRMSQRVSPLLQTKQGRALRLRTHKASISLSHYDE
jgi:hypothetical protein